MVCLYCGGRTRVVNSRLQRHQNAVWRRRACEACKSAFTTHERPALNQSVLVRSRQQKKLQPFSRDRLFLSLVEACKHRSRAIVECDALTRTVIAGVMQSVDHGVIERATIVAAARTVLGNFDTVAASVYAAYHPAGQA